MLVLASGNQKKIAELHALLAPHGIEPRGLDAVPGVGEIIEDGDSFAANAAIKARAVAAAGNCWAIGEDSGLCVDALDGAPGIYSARYAGSHGDDAANNVKLVAELAGVPAEKRAAHYVSHIALAKPPVDGEPPEVVVAEEATCHGLIVDEPRGTHGFGYDPHFLLREYHRTFAELGPAVKQAISHRARATRAFLPKLLRVL